MAKVTIVAENNLDEDGVENTVSVSQSVEDLNGLAQVFANAARAMGFTYVTDVGLETESGQVTFGERW